LVGARFIRASGDDWQREQETGGIPERIREGWHSAARLTQVRQLAGKMSGI
jgi:hypothetical protein